MKNKRYSIKSIAEELGVSITTVSFVINGKAKERRISEAVTKKILDYIDLIGYRPNQLAQSLRTGKSKIIVCMMEDISNNFFSKLARLIEDIAYEKGYKVIFCSTENNDEKSIELIDIFRERQVDGYIIIPSLGIRHKIIELQTANIPVVLCDRYFPDLDANYVVIDNENAAYQAAKHLIENNFKNIGFITTDVEQTQMIGRQTGYVKALNEHGLKPNILTLSYKEKVTGLSKAKILDFLLQNQDLDAMFFSTNYLTKNGLAVIKDNFGNAINNFGLLTFDDNDFFTIYTPEITAVAQPLEEMAKEVMVTMFGLLKNPEEKMKSYRKVILSTELKIRESSLEKRISF